MAMVPVVDRELRVASRKTSLYWGRLLFAGSAIVVGAIFLYSLSRDLPVRVGQQMFGFLVNMTFLYCALAGVWATSDCLSEERRSETLGLLFLTNLKSLDVVLGKLVATSLQSVYGVFAVVPVLAIPLILGGVEFEEFLRVMLVLGSVLLVSLSLGVFVSSRSVNAVKSGSAVFLLVLVLCGAGPLLILILDSSPIELNSAARMGFLYSSPAFALYHAYKAAYGLQPSAYWVSVLLSFGYSFGLLALASRCVSVSWKGTARRSEINTSGVQEREAEQDSGRGNSRVLDENPLLWKFSRRSRMRNWVFGGLGAIGLYWLWGSFSYGQDFYNEANYLFTAFLMQFMLKCWVGAEAATRFGEDRRSGALELLLCTPLKVREILLGHSQSFYWQFFWPVFFVLVVCFSFLLEPLTSRWALIDPSTRYWVRLFLVGIVLFVLDLYALCWLGMWKGLNARYVNRAVLSNLLTVMGLPWVGFTLFAILFSMFSGPRQMGGRAAEDVLLGVWLVLGSVSSGWWWYFGRNRLLDELRRRAPFQVGDTRFASS